MHLHSYTQECRVGKSRSLEEDKAAQSLWVALKPTVCRRKIILIGMQRLHSFIIATLSYTATSDFKPSHPPTSSPKPPLSSAINHHPATGHWAQSKVTLHRATNTAGGGKPREREKRGMERKREERAIGWEHGGKREMERECDLSTQLSQWEGNLWCKLYYCLACRDTAQTWVKPRVVRGTSERVKPGCKFKRTQIIPLRNMQLLGCIHKGMSENWCNDRKYVSFIH